MAGIRFFNLYGSSHWNRTFKMRTGSSHPIEFKSLPVDSSRRALQNRLFGRLCTIKTDGARAKKRFCHYGCHNGKGKMTLSFQGVPLEYETSDAKIKGAPE